MKKLSTLLLLFLVYHNTFSAISTAYANELEDKLQTTLDRFITDNAEIPGVMVSIISEKRNLDWQGAAGVSDLKTQQAIKSEQTVRLASTTKTYIAAAILRLKEQDKLSLNKPISQYLPNDQVKILQDGGYNPDQITTRHLLTHTSGIWDHASSQHYLEAVISDTTHHWTRVEQLKFAMDKGQPYGKPEEFYHYSDTGYVLLGEIVERRSGKPLAVALRTLLKFDALNLNNTWLETLEPRPQSALNRAHQYMGDMDITEWNATMDLYGGGGLVATMPDLARFFQALFKGKVFDKNTSLAEMKTTILPEHGGIFYNKSGYGNYQYCMGLYASHYRGYTIYQHGGFWNTIGAYIPALDVSFAVAVTQQHANEKRKKLVEDMLDAVIGSVLEKK
ncbi:serine hydrolase domain-containing protein [Paremcibacter congregatus]|nr:serine hydrolase domain-containing protein [Paremcibacter congregatus]